MAKGKSLIFSRNAIETIAVTTQLLLSDGEAALHEVLESCSDLVGADYGSIFILDKESQTLKTVTTMGRGNFSSIKSEIPISSIKTIPGYSVMTGQTYMSNDVYKDPNYYQSYEGSKTRSQISIPLRVEGRVIGVLNLESAKTRTFTIEQLQALEILSSIIATTLWKSALEKKEKEPEESSNPISQRPLVFVLMPFHDPFNKYYNAIIRPAIEKAKLRGLRADEIYGPTEIMKDIWVQINNAEIILAELTTKNPNVMYELGLSHSIGKPVIMLSQNIDDIPFDLRSLRCILYDTVETNWAEQLQNKIIKSIEAVLSSKDTQPSYFKNI